MPADPVAALLPCPFGCVKPPHPHSHLIWDQVTCYGDGGTKHGPFTLSRDAWNTRTPAPAGDVPIGWKLVPVEPTEAMIEAYHDSEIEPESAWLGMLEAAPSPTPDSSAVSEPCGYCGRTPCRCGRDDLCQAPGCDKPTDRGICDNCDQWVSDQVGTDSSAGSGSAEGKYLVWSNEHKAWWGAGHRGYTRFIERAGRYDRAEALKIASTRDGGWRLNKGNPDEIAIPEQDAIDQYADISREQAKALTEGQQS